MENHNFPKNSRHLCEKKNVSWTFPAALAHEHLPELFGTPRGTAVKQSVPWCGLEQRSGNPWEIYNIMAK